MQLPSILRNCAVLAAVTVLFCFSSRCLADPIALTTSAVASTLLGPSSDSISLNAASITSDDSSSGLTTFQSGDFVLGNSPIPDQIIPFSFEDTLTLNGITEVVNIAGQDNVTTTADILSIFAGAPVVFGGDVFTLQLFSETGTAIGQDMPLELQASIDPTPAPTPEPSSLVLLGTGLLAATLIATISRRSLVESIPATEGPIAFCNRLTPGKSWVRRGTTLHPAAAEGASSTRNSSPVAGSAGCLANARQGD
jgi:hypothetical protein